MTPGFTRTAFCAVIAVLALALAPRAFAESEVGDAGDLRATANDMGTGAVTTISGGFTDAADADLYRICLSNGTSFSATTVGTTTLDTQLFLFDSQGYGIYANDDSGGSHGSLLPAQHRFSPRAGGEYFLGISSFNRDPQSSQGEIFQDNFSRALYPDAIVDAQGFGAAQPLSGWAGRASGPQGTYRITLTGTKACDTTPPTVDLRVPADGARVKQGAGVAVDFSCADEDGGSGLASCAGTTADGAELDTSRLGDVSVSVTARDNAGNQTTVTHTVTIVDATAPNITVTTPPSAAVYGLGEQVTADYACADEDGGSGLATCAGTAPDGAAVDTSSVGEQTFTVEATDNAGNAASKRVTYTVVDQAPPHISLTAPSDGAWYRIGQQVAASYSCEDEPGGSGVASCTGTVANGAPIDTSSLGEHSFEVSTADRAGNTASTMVTYVVGYDFDGFMLPVKNAPNVNRWKAGLPVPIRFSLHGFRGARPEADGYPRSTRCGGGDIEQIARARPASKQPVFKYDRRSDEYRMLWKTEHKWTGTCREFLLTLDDGSVHVARFQFAKTRSDDDS